MRKLLLLTVLVMVPGWGCARSDPAMDSEGEETGAVDSSREPIPQTSFEDLDGSPVSFAQHRGRVLIVNFWGTWCVPCREELPELVDLHGRFSGRGVDIIGIAVDSGSADAIRGFADQFGVNYAIWTADTATVMSDFQAVGYPFTLLVDRAGNIAKEFYGAQTVETLATELETLLAE